jgi:hypothetical protein
MKKTINTMVFAVLLTLGVVSTVYAVDVDMPEYHNIVELKVFNSYRTVSFIHNFQASPPCNSGVDFRLLTSTVNSNEMFNMLLAAYLSGKNVRLEYYCSSSIAYINGVRMQD